MVTPEGAGYEGRDDPGGATGGGGGGGGPISFPPPVAACPPGDKNEVDAAEKADPDITPGRPVHPGMDPRLEAYETGAFGWSFPCSSCS